MTFFTATIQEKKQEVEDTYIFQLVPNETYPTFLPGQYCYLKNPEYKNPDEVHPFSIASSPLEKRYLEFCIKAYGQWTQTFAKKQIGEIIKISQPEGKFTWNNNVNHAVFLLGGIGISPIMSMLRSLVKNNHKPDSLTMLYGNRTPQTIAYNDELQQLQKDLPNFKIIHIFSHVPKEHPWKGYRGFITKDIIEREVHVDMKPIFFIVGPPIFLQKMEQTLALLNVEKNDIRKESLDIHDNT